jgi:Protein of unknown function (DUF2924)/Protein of unknown function (DUF3489)
LRGPKLPLLPLSANTPRPARRGTVASWRGSLTSCSATIPNLTEATGWLAHTTRAALTGLRKRGYAVGRERIAGGDSIYRVAGRPTDFEGRSLIESGAREGRDRGLEPKANPSGVIEVARRSATAGQATKQLAKAAPEASLPRDASAHSIVAGLEGHDLNGLRRHWRAHLGGEPPLHVPRWLLMRVLAYRLQVDAFGGLDKSIQRMLRFNKDRDAAAPFDRRAPQTLDGVGLKAGALLVRECKGQLERVMILEDSFAWNGRTFGSLSQIAKAMTGTNWNGHRFFGLRQGKTVRAYEASGRRKRRAGAAAVAKDSAPGERS